MRTPVPGLRGAASWGTASASAPKMCRCRGPIKSSGITRSGSGTTGAGGTVLDRARRGMSRSGARGRYPERCAVRRGIGR